ncbi:MAG TPA: hypothetical protein VIX17_14810 [Pyrinomonadaceae bacterium]|jgi:hypothetical protein
MDSIRHCATLFLIGGLVLAVGCMTAKDLSRTLTDIGQVRAQIIKRFGEEDVNVHVNTFQGKTAISVHFINSPLNTGSQEDRTRRAQETAELVKQYYPSIKKVSAIWVAFARVTSRFVVFHWTEVLDVHGYDNEARSLGDRDNAPVSIDPSKPDVRYSANLNTTEISSWIRLEGSPDNGVSMVPHFSVLGNVNKVTPKPPNEVSVDFASYSPQPRFPNVTRIVFMADNQIAYQTEGQFSTSKLADGTYSEFLYLKIPAAAFIKSTNGTSVKIKLANHEYRLSDIQLLQLQRMSDYIKT